MPAPVTTIPGTSAAQPESRPIREIRKMPSVTAAAPMLTVALAPMCSYSGPAAKETIANTPISGSRPTPASSGE